MNPFMTTESEDKMMAKLADRAERELAEDPKIIRDNVTKYDIQKGLEEIFGIKPEVHIESSKSFFGVTFVKAFAFMGISTIVIKARRLRSGYTVVKETTIGGERVKNAREMKSAIDEALARHLDDYR